MSPQPRLRDIYTFNFREEIVMEFRSCEEVWPSVLTSHDVIVVAYSLLSTLLTASLECSDLDSTTYSRSEAVLNPVEIAKLLWQD